MTTQSKTLKTMVLDYCESIGGRASWKQLHDFIHHISVVAVNIIQGFNLKELNHVNHMVYSRDLQKLIHDLEMMEFGTLKDVKTIE